MYLVTSLSVLRAGCGIGFCQFLIIAYLFTLNDIIGSLFALHVRDTPDRNRCDHIQGDSHLMHSFRNGVLGNSHLMHSFSNGVLGNSHLMHSFSTGVLGKRSPEKA